MDVHRTILIIFLSTTGQTNFKCQTDFKIHNRFLTLVRYMYAKLKILWHREHHATCSLFSEWVPSIPQRGHKRRFSLLYRHNYEIQIEFATQKQKPFWHQIFNASFK